MLFVDASKIAGSVTNSADPYTPASDQGLNYLLGISVSLSV